MAKTKKKTSSEAAPVISPLWHDKKEEPFIAPQLDSVRIATVVTDEKKITQIETFRYYKPDAFHVPWEEIVEENRIVSWCYFVDLLSAQTVKPYKPKP